MRACLLHGVSLCMCDLCKHCMQVSAAWPRQSSTYPRQSGQWWRTQTAARQCATSFTGTWAGSTPPKGTWRPPCSASPMMSVSLLPVYQRWFWEHINNVKSRKLLLLASVTVFMFGDFCSDCYVFTCDTDTFDFPVSSLIYYWFIMNFLSVLFSYDWILNWFTWLWLHGQCVFIQKELINFRTKIHTQLYKSILFHTEYMLLQILANSRLSPESYWLLYGLHLITYFVPSELKVYNFRT